MTKKELKEKNRELEIKLSESVREDFFAMCPRCGNEFTTTHIYNNYDLKQENKTLKEQTDNLKERIRNILKALNEKSILVEDIVDWI